MPLSAEEVLTLVQITRRTRAEVQAKADAADADMENELRGHVEMWRANRGEVDVELTGEVNLKARRLLDAIRDDVLSLLEWPTFVEASRPSLPGSVVIGSCVRW